MRILFLTNMPSPYRVDFFNELGKLCDLTVLYERKNAKDRFVDWTSNNAQTFKAVYLAGINYGNDSALCFGVLKWLSNKSFDLIVIGGYSTLTGMLAIEFLNHNKIPFLLNSDGGIIKNDSWIKYNIKRHFISSAAAWLSTGINTTQYLVHYRANKEMIYYYPFTSVKNADILENAISIKEKLELRRKLKIGEDKVIVAIGQFIHRKGLDVLINACQLLSCKIGVFIVGGEPTQEYISIMKELNISNVHFIRFKQGEELKEYYKAADLFVLPTREDIWGLVINEAMANGLPIITTDRCVAGLELVKDGENGFIVPIDDAKALSDTINTILNNENLLSEMSKSSLKRIRGYSIENMAKRHIDIFKEVLGNV